MVVDDEPDITLTYKIGLENYGFIVDIYNEPDLALSNFKSGLYDLVIIDMKMPKMNGFELYQKIMKIDDKVKVCFLTAGEMATHYEMFRDLDSEKNNNNSLITIQKPIGIQDLVRRIKAILQ